MSEAREHGGWNRCRECKHDGPCPCSGEACCDKFLLCGHCPEAPGHIDECCILLEYSDLLAAVERLQAQLAAVQKSVREARGVANHAGAVLERAVPDEEARAELWRQHWREQVALTLDDR